MTLSEMMYIENQYSNNVTFLKFPGVFFFYWHNKKMLKETMLFEDLMYLKTYLVGVYSTNVMMPNCSHFLLDVLLV